MIPVEGLFISQYKMLEGFHLLNTVAGLTLVYVASVLPFTVWTLRGFVAGVPYELEEAAMIDGCSRFGASADHLPAAGARPGGDRCLRLHPGVERVHAGRGGDDPRGQEDAAGVAGRLLDVNRGIDWGAVMAGSTLIAVPVIIFFLIVQGRMVVRADGRGGEGMTLPGAAGARRCCCPRSTGTTVPPACVGLLDEGLGGLCLSAATPPTDRTPWRRYTATVRGAAPCAVVAVDEEGGDVTRLHARTAARCSVRRARCRRTTSS